MNSFDFWEAIGDIDDSFVFEVKELKKERKTMRGIPFVMKGAACLLLLIGLALFWQSNKNYQHNMKSGDERGMDENTVVSEKDRGIDENAVISEKESGESHNSASADWNDDVPEADVNTKNEQMSSSEPLVGFNSQVPMTAKKKKDVLAIMIENKSNYKIFFGEEYVLYRKHNDELERIEYLPGVGVHDLAYELKKAGTYTDEIKLADTFGKLESGKYIVGKEITLKGRKVAISAEFEIK